MANPHHRKKHKEHLRQFQHSRDSYTKDVKGKGTNIFAIVGAVIGLAIGYFAGQGSIIWIAAGAIAGAGIGYLFGYNIDKSAGKK